MIRRALRILLSLQFACENCRRPTRAGHYVKPWAHAAGFWLCDEVTERRREP